MTEIPSVVKPVCKLILMRRCTSHRDFGFFTSSQGTRKTGMKGAITNSGNFPTWAGASYTWIHRSKRAARKLPARHLGCRDTQVLRSWKVTFKLVLSSTCPLSSKEYSNNSVYYYLWSVYHLPNIKLNSLWIYLCQPSWLPGFEVSLPPSVDEVIEGFRFK